MQRYTDVSVKYEMCPGCGSIIQAVTVGVLGPLPQLACTLPPFSKAGEDFINKNKKIVRDDTSYGRDENLFSFLFYFSSYLIL